MENDNVVLGVFWVGFFFFSTNNPNSSCFSWIFFYMFLTLLLNTETYNTIILAKLSHISYNNFPYFIGRFYSRRIISHQDSVSAIN